MSTPQLDRLVPDYIKGFQAYIPSKPDPELMRLYGVDHLYRLNNNENPLGPPAAARRVLAEFDPAQAAIYPSGDVYYLRQALARKFGLDPDQFLCGNGANEVIAFVIKAFCQAGDNIITADRTFAVYEWVAEFSGFEARLTPLRDFRFDPAAMLARVDARSKIHFVCNPNNPTGTWWDQAELTAFLDAVNGRQIVVVDEAYAEFVEDPAYPDSLGLLARYPNLVVFRTFSKMYGLAGLRIGYLAGSPEVVDVIRRTCVVYSVNGLAQEAALAALEHGEEHIAATRRLVREEKAYLRRELGRLGLTVQDDQGCYLMLRLAMSDTLAYRKLMAQGVMIRSMTGFRYPNWIRVSVGHHQAMADFVRALENILYP
ncbi:MAG: histidinol-phosphate transaminase [Deltaproteobacteria bacterium]|nr:histidinol-phosphate transaminase [Deltaproteobacteria bacterium]